MTMTKRILPSQRSLKFLRDQGYHVATVEKWNPFAGPMVNGKRVGRRQDLWGVFDILAFTAASKTKAEFWPDLYTGVLAIQSTTKGELAKRVRKILDAGDVVSDWLQAGNRVQVHGWWRGWSDAENPRRIWKVKVKDVTLEDFA